MKTLIIDNYDSFTFNLYQLVATVTDKLPIVISNDQLNWKDFLKLKVDNIIISPGPGRPDRKKDFGISEKILQDAQVPVLGICLGHEGLGTIYGAKLIHAPEIMHGVRSVIYHDNSQLFRNIPSHFFAVRYHSFIVEEEALPDCLEKTAWTEKGIVMGLAHKVKPLFGVQFHPESIGSEYGKQLIQNYIDSTLHFQKKC